MTHESNKDYSECEGIRELISAKLDGEATVAELQAVLNHLEDCSDCVVYESELLTMHSVLSSERVPGFDAEQLWGKVQNEIDRIDSGGGSDAGDEGWNYSVGRWLASVAVAACLIISVTVGSILMVSPQNALLPVVAETVRDFETFRLRGELLDVGTNSTTEVVQWMSAKLDFELPETLTPPPGYEITGGRLCSFLNRRLAFFQYEKNTVALSMYVMKAEGLAIPPAGDYQTSTSGEGLTTVTWARDELAYVVVSDLPPPEVVAFALGT